MTLRWFASPTPSMPWMRRYAASEPADDGRSGSAGRRRRGPSPGGAGRPPRRGRQGRDRPGRSGHRTGHRAALPRPRLARGCAWSREDVAGAGAGRGAGPGHQASPVHAGPDAGRRDRFAGVRRPNRRVLLPRRPGFHQPAPRRRDKPNATEDPGQPAGGDGGAAGLSGGHAAAAAGAVRRGGDPEPDRVRGHLSAARGPARPVPAQAHDAGARPAGRDPHPWRPPRRLRPARPDRRRPDSGGRTGGVGARSAPSLSLGASPRAATALLASAKAWAWLSGRDFLTPDDVKALARPTLRHRISLRPEAELEGVTADGVLDSVLATVPVPR